MWMLQTLTGEQPEQTFRILPGGVRTVGRATGADFIVDAALVSRVHCRLTALPDGQLEVRDLESTNGTFVNGQRIEAARLSDGDRLQIGRLELVVTRDMTRPQDESESAAHGSASRHGSSDDASTSALRSCRPLCLDRHSIHAGGRRPPAMLSSLFADPRAHKPLWSSAPRRSPRLVLVVVVPSTERDYLPAKYSSTNGLVVRSRPMVVSGPCPGWTMASSPRGNSTCVIDRISVA